MQLNVTENFCRWSRNYETSCNIFGRIVNSSNIQLMICNMQEKKETEKKLSFLTNVSFFFKQNASSGLHFEVKLRKNITNVNINVRFISYRSRTSHFEGKL